MPETNDSAQEKLHFTTRVLTEGFDPRLSVGSARPAVLRARTAASAGDRPALRPSRCRGTMNSE